MKTISFRVNEDDLERIEQLKTKFKEMYHIKITTSDVLINSITNLWTEQCLPYQDEKPYKYRAEKD